MENKIIGIYGAGGFAREVAWLAQDCGYSVGCFIDDDEAKQHMIINNIPVVSLTEAQRLYPDLLVVGAVGSPKLRELLVSRASAAGFNFATLIHPRVERSSWIEFGSGTVICAGCVLTTNIVIGKHVQINLNCTVGHDVVMGNFATLAPGVHISGCVRIGRGVYIGTGAVIINGSPEEPLLIGDDATIGAGAVVLNSVPSGVTVVGVPAKPISCH